MKVATKGLRWPAGVATNKREATSGQAILVSEN
jgi:hypothetical protein